MGINKNVMYYQKISYANYVAKARWYNAILEKQAATDSQFQYQFLSNQDSALKIHNARRNHYC